MCDNLTGLKKKIEKKNNNFSSLDIHALNELSGKRGGNAFLSRMLNLCGLVWPVRE